MKNSPLWIAQTPCVELLSPYLLHPSPLYLTNDYFPLILFLDWLADEEINQELLETAAGRVLLKYRQLAIGAFFRKYIDNSFSYWKASRKMKSILNLEMDLWITTLRMLGKLQPSCPFFTESHFAVFWVRLIIERQLMVLISPTEGLDAVKEYIQSRQSQNRKLQGCENPFKRDEYPATWKFVQQAITIADRNDDFRREFYMPMVRARQKFVTAMKKGRFRLYRQAILQWQGRKKRKKL